MSEHKTGPIRGHPKFPMNIDQELYNGWQYQRKHEDVKKLAKYCGVSEPIISRALNNGNAKKDALVQNITKYFLLRKAKQKNNINLLKQL